LKRSFRRIITSSDAIGFLASLGSQLRLRHTKQEFYSQSHEDSIIASFLPEKLGRYLDVGSGRPISGSNSYYFYKLGWQGILIDPLSRNEKLNKLLRPRDKFFRVLVGNPGKTTFYETYPYEYSTTSTDYFEKMLRLDLVKLKKKSFLKICSLSDFNLRVRELEPFFLSIDAEGTDFEILKSNDWALCRPRVVCIESPIDIDPNSDAIVAYMEGHGYFLVEQTQLSKIFVSNAYLKSVDFE
jgi:hypothetical protein